MTKPQQPELRRSGLGATDQDSAKANIDGNVHSETGGGRVPPENQPGHHPEHEQDQPAPPQ